MAFIIWTMLFLFFMLGFLFHKKRPEWKSSGMVVGFIIALFAEMFGLPLTIYILSSFLGMSDIYGAENLRILLIGRNPVELIFVVLAFLLILVGFALMAVGWHGIYNSKDKLVTKGIYCRLRHPQYLGLMMITLGLLVWWPTVLTLVMWPILCAMYCLLAKREEKEMTEKFGAEYSEYRKRVNMFMPFKKPRGK